VLEEQEDAVVGAGLRRLADTFDQPGPAVRVRGLEGVVVALDPGPDDEVGAERAGELGRGDRAPLRLLANLLVGRDEPASPEAGVEVEPRGDAVDPVAVERSAHLVEVLLGELLRVVELVAVDEVAEPLDGPAHALRGRLARVLRLVAAGDEARDHRSEGPDAEARLHALL